MPERIPKSVAKNVVFRAISSTDHFTPKTSVSPAITIRKWGGSFGNPAAGATTATEISSGFYYFSLGTGDTDTDGPLAWRAAVSGMDDVGDVYEVVAATNAGFTGIPAAVAGASGGLIINGSNTGAVTLNGLTTGALAASSVSVSGNYTINGVTTHAAVTFAAFTTAAFTPSSISVSGNVAVIGSTTFAGFATGAFTPSSISVVGTTSLSGAVSFGSTWGVTGTTTFAAINTGTIATTGNWTVSGSTTLTGAVSATNVSNDIRGVLLQATQTGVTIPVVTTLTNAPANGDLTATMKASVNAEVVDAINTDTYAEPGQGAPGATISLAAKIGYLYKAWRNKKEQTATTMSLYADNTTTVDQKAAVSDDGTTTTVGEIATGP